MYHTKPPASSSRPSRPSRLQQPPGEIALFITRQSCRAVILGVFERETVAGQELLRQLGPEIGQLRRAVARLGVS